MRDLIEGDVVFGQMVSLTGFIFTHWNPEKDMEEGVLDNHFLAPSLDSWQDKQSCIFIGRPTLEREIRSAGVLSKVGGLNGGGLSYECSIEGRLVPSTCREYELELTDLENLSIKFKNKRKVISLG